MANTPPRSDRSLLERLNALKPTSVALDRQPTSSLFPTDTAQSGGSPFSQDALSARLRELRNQPGREPTAASAPPPTARGASSGADLQGAAVTAPAGSSEKDRAGRRLSATSPSAVAGVGGVTYDDDHDGGDIDPLYMLDDKALDDYLDEVNAYLLGEDGSSWEVDAAAASKRVSETLAKFEKGGGSLYYDSDDEETNKNVANILSQARDEAEIDRDRDREQGQEDPRREPDLGAAPADTAEPDPHEGGPNKLHEATDLSLPSVPSALVDLALPDEADESESPEQAGRNNDFESDIAARMAALKGVGPDTSGGDSFGLPSAPTFQPEDRPVPKVVRKLGYTDEDQKTWCIVCLEDATVRCIGCDDDVYCARCWKDMHVGPHAGYEERGHQWVKFQRR